MIESRRILTMLRMSIDFSYTIYLRILQHHFVRDQLHQRALVSPITKRKRRKRRRRRLERRDKLIRTGRKDRLSGYMVQALFAQVKKDHETVIMAGSRRAILHCFFVESRNHPRPFYTFDFKGKVSGTEIIYERKFKCEKDVAIRGERRFTRRSYEEERGFLAGSIKRDHRGFWEWRYLLSVDSLFFWNKRVSECVRSRFKTESLDICALHPININSEETESLY